MARKLRNIEGFVQKPGKRTRVTLDGGMVEEEIDNVVVQPSIKSQSGIIRKPRKRHQTQRALTSDAESDIEISEEIELSLAELEADDNLGADNLDVPEVKESKNKSDKPKKFIKTRREIFLQKTKQTSGCFLYHCKKSNEFKRLKNICIVFICRFKSK